MFLSGSIIGHQQDWMEEKQPEMWLQGDQFRRKNRDKVVMGTKCPYPIYSQKLKEILTEEMNRRIAKSDPNFTRFHVLPFNVVLIHPKKINKISQA
jgi:hypothetical protein